MDCMQCGNEFEAKRRDARFCGPGCQKAHKRAELKKSVVPVLPVVDELGQVSTKQPIMSDILSDIKTPDTISDKTKREADKMIKNAWHNRPQ